MNTTDRVPRPRVDGVYGLGTRTVPVAIERLTETGMRMSVVAVLREVWYRAGDGFAVVDQSTLARHLGVSLSTAHRALKIAVKQGSAMVMILFWASLRRRQF